MDILRSTQEFEAWLGEQVAIHSEELAYKHQQMANRETSFPFFRGTYYRWAQVWPELCPELQAGPRVLSVGDLHVENFGTWRDRDGRLIWGINDFDEADELAVTNDLVRLATSVWFTAQSANFKFGFRKACRAILEGYLQNLRRGGQPFVLEEEHPALRRLALHEERDPVAFWKKLTKLLEAPESSVPEEAQAVLLRALPQPVESCVIRSRLRVGMGSLGKPRFVALAQHAGGWIAREAKALCSPATQWVNRTSSTTTLMGEVLGKAVRCCDPLFGIDGHWIIRRLAPRCSRIELTHLSNTDDELPLLSAMGSETANIHAGTATNRQALIEHLDALSEDWLELSAHKMAQTLQEDWKTWCRETIA